MFSYMASRRFHHGFQSGKERCQDCGAFILAQM
ncbi:Uncharacterised protein [Alistipes sp. cv1]|nr:Uncharacterised protein [Faecalibacterium prausnitzii]